jgi:uncharacterized protein (DUF2267 family)
MSSDEEARRATEAVLRSLLTVMPPEEVHPIYVSVPEILQPADAAAPPHIVRDVETLLGLVARESLSSPDRARYYTQAVFGALVDAEPRLADVLTRWWPDLVGSANTSRSGE